MNKEQDVAVTGIGLVSPLGTNLDSLWDSILSRKNGISYLPSNFEYLNKYGLNLAGVASNFSFNIFNEISLKSKKNIIKLNMQTQMLMYAFIYALFDAKLDYVEQDISSIIGCGTCSIKQYENSTLDEEIPTSFFNTYPNILLGRIYHYLSLKGYGMTILGACCGGMQAIGEAYKKIKNNEEEIMLAGGTDDKLNELSVCGYSKLGMFSTSTDPNNAMNPFDKNRNGFVIGQGACVLVLERMDRALARGATIYGKIKGYGTCIDPLSISDASSNGKIRAMEKALSDANISYEKVGYINAHGTATKSNDYEESKAIEVVFKDFSDKIPVSSTKSYIGHTFAACGAIQSAICLQTLKTQTIHDNRNFVVADKDVKLNLITRPLRVDNLEYCIGNTSGLGGYNASLVFQRYK